MTSTILHSPHESATWSTSKTWLGVAAIFLAVAAVAVTGALVTTPAVRTWYPNLPRPAWTPPDWTFGPVWTVLYAMMAVAAFACALHAARQYRATLGVVHTPPAADFLGGALAAQAYIALVQRADVHAGRAYGAFIAHQSSSASSSRA